MTKDEWTQDRDLYRQSLLKYAWAVRGDIDDIIAALETGQDLDDDKIVEYQRTIVVLGSALTTYSRTRTPESVLGVDE
jgi:hypothetical protein